MTTTDRPLCTPGRSPRCYRDHVDNETASMPLTGRNLALPGGSDTLTRAQRGDLTAFDELMRQHEARVFSIALRYTGRRADAEELTQDVFVHLHGSLGHITDADHLRRWLLRTITHRCLNRLRDQRRRPHLVPIETMPADAEPIAPETGSDPLAGSHLRRLLLELAPEARVVLLLRFQEDLDPSDIAAALDMPVNTVKSHLRRSLELLRAKCTGDEHGS
jgi:RNA polymerase sigma-70 factor, ECF subfamily